jgi:pimeloyl-ACP methyl ester carboxylesterase
MRDVNDPSAFAHQHVTVNGIGHSAPEEAPDLVSSHLIDFLNAQRA